MKIPKRGIKSGPSGFIKPLTGKRNRYGNMAVLVTFPTTDALIGEFLDAVRSKGGVANVSSINNLMENYIRRHHGEEAE